MKPYLAQIRSNLRLMARDRTVLFFNLFFPLMFFAIFAVSFGGSKNPAAWRRLSTWSWFWGARQRLFRCWHARRSGP